MLCRECDLFTPSDKRARFYECFLDDLKRCEALGLELYNFQYVPVLFSNNCFNLSFSYLTQSPGSTVGETTTENSISLIAECINQAHKATNTIKIVMENMVRLCHRSCFEIRTMLILDVGRRRENYWCQIFRIS